MSKNIFSLDRSADLSISDEIFQDIVELYDYADKILNLIETMNQDDMINNFMLVEPLIQDLRNSTKLIVHEYVEHFRGISKPDFIERRKRIILNQLSNIYDKVNLILR